MVQCKESLALCLSSIHIHVPIGALCSESAPDPNIPAAQSQKEKEKEVNDSTATQQWLPSIQAQS